MMEVHPYTRNLFCRPTCNENLYSNEKGLVEFAEEQVWDYGKHKCVKKVAHDTSDGCYLERDWSPPYPEPDFSRKRYLGISGRMDWINDTTQYRPQLHPKAFELVWKRQAENEKKRGRRADEEEDYLENHIARVGACFGGSKLRF